MIAYAYATQSEKTVSGALTLLMHGLFLVLLMFGVAWQKRERPAITCSLPSAPAWCATGQGFLAGEVCVKLVLHGCAGIHCGSAQAGRCG